MARGGRLAATRPQREGALEIRRGSAFEPDMHAYILMDAEAAGTLIDDRFKIEGFEDVLRQMAALKAGWVADKAAREAA